MGTRSVSVSAPVLPVAIWRDFFTNIFFFQIQVHDFEYQTQRRWFQGWLHKMAIYDNPHLGWISQRKMVPWGRFQKQRFLFQIVKISCLNLFCLRVANWYSVFVETDKTIHSKLNYLCYLCKLGCPERGPAQGTPTFWRSGQVGVDSIRPRGAPGQGSEGP